MQFEGHGGDISDRGVPASAVVSVFDPGSDFPGGAVAGGPHAAVVELGFQRREEALGHRVIPANAGQSHRAGDAILERERGDLGRGVLGRFNWWKQHLDYGGGLWDVQRVGWPHNLGGSRCGHRADPPFPSPQVGDVADPDLVQGPGVPFSFDGVDGVRVGVVDDRGGPPLFGADSHQSEALHGLGDGLARDGLPVSTEVREDPGRTVNFVGVAMELGHFLLDALPPNRAI